MSTKNLARTVIEGGRANRNKYDRHLSNREQRATTRNYISRVLQDPEYAYEADIEERRHVGKEFTDKLSPMYAWLVSRVGRTWAEVRAEIAEKFDTRSMAGRHVVYCHLLKEVANVGTPQGYFFRYREDDFWVDEDDVLCMRADYNHRHPYRVVTRKAKPVYNDRQVWSWVGDRRIIESGAEVFWGAPCLVEYRHCTDRHCARPHKTRIRYEAVSVHATSWKYKMAMEKKYKWHRLPEDFVDQFFQKAVEVRECAMGNGRYRQDVALSDADLAIYAQLADYQKDQIRYLTEAEMEAKSRADRAWRKSQGWNY